MSRDLVRPAHRVAPSGSRTRAQWIGSGRTSRRGAGTNCRRPVYREFTPVGTTLPLELTSSIASDVSEVEDTVRATLRNAVTVDGQEVLPAGTEVAGHVTEAERAGRVKDARAWRFALRACVMTTSGCRCARSPSCRKQKRRRVKTQPR